MSDATLARMEHGKYVGVREESRHDGVCTLRKQTPYAAYACRKSQEILRDRSQWSGLVEVFSTMIHLQAFIRLTTTSTAPAHRRAARPHTQNTVLTNVASPNKAVRSFIRSHALVFAE